MKFSMLSREKKDLRGAVSKQRPLMVGAGCGQGNVFTSSAYDSVAKSVRALLVLFVAFSSFEKEINDNGRTSSILVLLYHF